MSAVVEFRNVSYRIGAKQILSGLNLSVEEGQTLVLLGRSGSGKTTALRMVNGKEEWVQSKPGSWRKEVDRFHASLLALDRYLASEQPLAVTPEELFQGPISDALTHIGQIAIMRRQDNSPVRSEVYAKANISAGRVGTEQPKSPFEFDSPPAVK